jgi:hypothetical protein
MRTYLKTSDSEIIFIDSLFSKVDQNEAFIIGELKPFCLTIIIGDNISKIRISSDLINSLYQALQVGKMIRIEDFKE